MEADRAVQSKPALSRTRETDPRAAPGATLRFKPRGVTRVLKACVASWQGLAGAFREEAAFRQELGFAALVIP